MRPLVRTALCFPLMEWPPVRAPSFESPVSPTRWALNFFFHSILHNWLAACPCGLCSPDNFSPSTPSSFDWQGQRLKTNLPSVRAGGWGPIWFSSFFSFSQESVLLCMSTFCQMTFLLQRNPPFPLFFPGGKCFMRSLCRLDVGSQPSPLPTISSPLMFTTFLDR